MPNCPLSQNLKGLYNYVGNIYAHNERSKKLFLLKIRTFVCEFSLIPESGEIPDIKNLIQELASKTEAIIFTPPNSIISKCSIGQHFIDSNLNLVLNSIGSSEVDFYGKDIEAQYAETEKEYTNYLASLPEEQKFRKLENEKWIKTQGIKVNKYLPIIASENEVTLRSPEEISKRVAVMAVINGFVSNYINAEKVTSILKEQQLWESTTAKEKDLISHPTEEKKSAETWKCEGIWTLLWALGIGEDLGAPSAMCDLGHIPKEKYPLQDLGNFISSNTTSRSKKEIVDMADLYYRLDWAAVDLRLKGVQMGAINQGVVYERHYALNWLINYMGQDWDNISCDT